MPTREGSHWPVMERMTSSGDTAQGIAVSPERFRQVSPANYVRAAWQNEEPYKNNEPQKNDDPFKNDASSVTVNANASYPPEGEIDAADRRSRVKAESGTRHDAVYHESRSDVAPVSRVSRETRDAPFKDQTLLPSPRDQAPAVPKDLWPRRANVASRIQRPSQLSASRPSQWHLQEPSLAERPAGADQVDSPNESALVSDRDEQYYHDQVIPKIGARDLTSISTEDMYADGERSPRRLRNEEGRMAHLPLTSSASSSQEAQKPPQTSESMAGSRQQPRAGREGTISSYTSSPAGQNDQRRQNVRVRNSVEGFSKIRNGRRYRLVVVQHPERARMCGYGDKDRRPLSPSLIVKLVITDEVTGAHVSPWEVNTSLFVLASDLCDPDQLVLIPRNLLLNTQLAAVPVSMLNETGPQLTPRGPSAAASAALSGNLNFQSLHGGMRGGVAGEHHDYDSRGIRRDDAGPEASTSRMGPPPPPATSSSGLTSLSSAYEHQLYHQQLRDQSRQTATVTTEHYARNLVGAGVTSANILRDERDEYQIFFVLQDLSVRAEGTYRIRLLFTDLSQGQGQTNEGISETLAEAYTEPFSVYTPRRFPGMLEPTELSKKLASQGIKIAVRSDKKKRQRDASDPSAGTARGLAGPSNQGRRRSSEIDDPSSGATRKSVTSREEQEADELEDEDDDEDYD